ncbi:alpha carbonic anhydrase [Chytriomyces sp. MP71]|nr:alpha carbonic anhydrase [Chytriomyces sp. MP71]
MPPVPVCWRAHDRCPCSVCQHHKVHGKAHPELPTLHDWEYHGPKGPANWNLIEGVVDTGKQSPVDFVDTTLQFPRTEFTPSIHYHNAPAAMDSETEPMGVTMSVGETPDACHPVQLHVENTGHSVQINFPLSHDDAEVKPGGYVLLRGKKFHLKQIHFHAPAEHRTHGKIHRMEAHFVHASDAGTLLVIGIFLDVAEEQHTESATFLDFVLEQEVPKEKGDARHHAVHEMDLEAAARVIRDSESYYSYEGSLTTPPLSEGVHWIVCSDAVPVKHELIVAIEAGLPKGNYRPAKSSKAYPRPTKLTAKEE